jgi:hypothetical protein
MDPDWRRRMRRDVTIVLVVIGVPALFFLIWRASLIFKLLESW